MLTGGEFGGAGILSSRQVQATRLKVPMVGVNAGSSLHPPGTGGCWILAWPRETHGFTLLGEPAHLPFPWGTVLGARGALPPPPGPLVSEGTVDVGRLLVRRPLLGSRRLSGSVFRPFSWRARRVILTPESCGEKSLGSVGSSPHPTQDSGDSAWGVLREKQPCG